MAHSQVPADKIGAYLATEYRFGEGSAAVVLHIDRRSDELARLYAFSGAARNLGTRYRQDAIVWAGADAVPKLILLR